MSRLLSWSAAVLLTLAPAAPALADVIPEGLDRLTPEARRQWYEKSWRDKEEMYRTIQRTAISPQDFSPASRQGKLLPAMPGSEKKQYVQEMRTSIQRALDFQSVAAGILLTLGAATAGIFYVRRK